MADFHRAFSSFRKQIVVRAGRVIALQRHREIYGNKSDLISYESSLKTLLSCQIQADFGYVAAKENLHRLMFFASIAVFYIVMFGVIHLLIRLRRIVFK